MWVVGGAGHLGLLPAVDPRQVTILVSSDLTGHFGIWELLHAIQAYQGLPYPQQDLQGRADADRALLTNLSRIKHILFNCVHSVKYVVFLIVML